LREDQLEDAFYSQCQNASFTRPQGSEQDWMTFSDAGVSPGLAKSLLESMIMTRVAHNVSRREAIKGNVYYTIGPGGNESVSAVAAAMRATDPSILHYRDTAFQFMRSSMVGLSAEESMMQMMRSYTCSASDCNSGGRHKALGDPKLHLVPSTSTISSQYPRGIGMAASIPLVKRLKTPGQAFAPESIVMMSGGDASINHATFQTSVNFARYTHLGRRMPLPALFLVSDNGYGISVPTPEHWIEQCLGNLGLPYEFADATQLPAVYAQALKVAESARKGTPSFLHLKTSRLFNHAGSDAGNYMNPQQHAWHAERDPIPTAAFTLQQEGIMNAKEIEEMYKHAHALAEDSLQKAMLEPKLSSVEDIMQPLVQDLSKLKRDTNGEIESWEMPKSKKRGMILKQQINSVLSEAMEADPTVVLFGEDVADKGGNYGVTDGLKKKFGPMRVRDTLLDETSILGLALGFSLNGLTPIAEICYLAYIHNAIDQVRV
jgi:2-oxoisovalerate dehydrogenase E1 component